MAVTAFRKWGGTALAAVLTLQASAARAVCITEPEAKSVALFLAPDMIRTLASTCRAALPANAYLTRSSGTLIDRYRPVSEANWPGVQTLLGRIPETKMFAGLDESAARGMIGAVLQDKALGKISASDCAMANQMLEALDPLPPQNMASFLVALARLGEAASNKRMLANQKPKASVFCPALPR